MTITGPNGSITHALMTADEYRGTSPFLRRRIKGRPHLLVDCPVRGRTEVPVVLTGSTRTSSPIRKGGRTPALSVLGASPLTLLAA